MGIPRFLHGTSLHTYDLQVMNPPSYSLDLARSALPLVRSIAEDRAGVVRELRARRTERDRLRGRPDAPQGPLNDLHREVIELEQRLAELRVELAELGLRLDDEATSTIVFPGDLDGVEVLFSWIPGEEDIEHYRRPGDPAGARHRLPVPVGT